MGSIRCDHDPATTRPYPDHLKAGAVTPDTMKGQTGRQLGDAIVEDHTSGIELSDESNNILDIVGVAQERVAHTAPGGVSTLGVLHVKACSWERVESAGMVVVQMRENDV